ncbi:MAG: ABC transporter ATP-binding protein [Methanomassiliicoccales archaeon]
MIRVEGLTYRYPKSRVPSVRDVSMSIREGEFLILVGPSGCGKSTLCRSFNGLVPHFYGGDFQGRVTVDGEDTRELQPARLAEKVGMVFQDPENQLVMTNVENEMAFGMENLGVPRQEMKRRVARSAEFFDLGPLMKRFIPELSGGEKQKVALGSVLAMSPKYLILDEPTSQLDEDNARRFLQFAQTLNREMGVAIILVEHRLERCMEFAKRMVFMKEGEVIMDGEPGEVIEHLREIDLISDLRVPSEQNGHSRERAVQVNDLHFGYNGTRVLQGLDLEVRKGEVVMITGDNGAGKSTLLKLIMGLLRPERGSMEVLGEDVGRTTTAQQASRVGYLGQNPNDYLFEQTLERELEFTLRNLDVPSGEWEVRIDWALRTVDLDRYRHTFPRDLSTGEKERAALATVLVGRPDVLILDEPTRGLDHWMKGKLGEVILSLQGEGMTSILVTHDHRFIAEYAIKVFRLEGGRIREMDRQRFAQGVREGNGWRDS